MNVFRDSRARDWGQRILRLIALLGGVVALALSARQASADDCTPTPPDLTGVDISTAVATNAPVPLVIPEPSGRNEALHPSVVFIPEGWNGYRYWMLYTPYDFSVGSNENPHVDVSNDGQHWIQAPGVSNPIEPWPGGGSYNSDTDLLLGPDNTMYAFWRTASNVFENISYRTSTDGSNWVNETLALRVSAFQRQILSPGIVFDGGQWWMWTVNGIAHPTVVELWTASSPSGPWSGPTPTDLVAPAGKELWHTEARRVGDEFIQLIVMTDIGSNTNGVLYLASSVNGTNWTRGASAVLTGTLSLTWDYTLYRSAFVPLQCSDGLKLAIWYTGRGPFGYNLVGYTEAAITGIIPPRTQTYSVSAGSLQDRSGNPTPTDSVAVLVANTGNAGFTNPQPNFPLSLGAHWGDNNIVVGLWDLSADGIPGFLDDGTTVTNGGPFAPGQKLQLYWFPSLTLSSNVVGRTYYGKYTDTNSPPLDGSDPWMLATNASVRLSFKTDSQSGSNPEAAGRATLSTVPPLAASFSASRAFGASPLIETFTDTSMGFIANRFWDFGDGVTLTTTATRVTHTYAAGSYAVTLAVADPFGISTDATTSVIEVLTPFQIWQLQYFSCTNCPEADSDADFDGDRFTNQQEFLAGTDPTDPHSSPFQITAIAMQGNDILLTWTTVGGTTNIAQAMDATADYGCWSNFVDISPPIQIPDTTVTSTNYLDPGASTNYTSRLYRIRLVP